MAPPASVMVVVTVTEVAACDWFCTSVLTETVADELVTVGVVTNTPLYATWIGSSVVSQTLR